MPSNQSVLDDLIQDQVVIVLRVEINKEAEQYSGISHAALLTRCFVRDPLYMIKLSV